METKNNGKLETKLIQIDNTTTHKLYEEKDGKKTLSQTDFGGLSPKPVRGTHLQNTEETSPFVSYTVFMNIGYSENFLQRVSDSIVTGVKTKEVDGKECYEISCKNNSNHFWSEDANKVIIYVEKDTGLVIKEVITTNEYERIITYEYKFDCVIDTDMMN